MIACRKPDLCIAGKVVATDFQCQALTHSPLVSGNLWYGQLLVLTLVDTRFQRSSTLMQRAR